MRKSHSENQSKGLEDFENKYNNCVSEKKLYLDILELTRDGIWVSDKNDIIFYTNHGMEQIAGVTKNEIIGNHVLKDFSEDTIGVFKAYYQKAKETLKPVKYQARVVTPANKETIQDSWLIPRLKDVQYNGMICTIKDITEQKKFEEFAIEKEKMLQQTLDATADGIWTWNFLTDQLYFSPKYYTMLGYKPNEFSASFQDWVKLIHPDDKEEALKVAQTFLATKPDIYENEFRLRTKSGEYRWFRARAKVVERDSTGQAVFMIGNHEDVTHQRYTKEQLICAKEKAQEANELKSQFLRNISHELRTPLNGIVGMLSLLMEQNHDSKISNYLNNIQYCSQNLLNLVNDLLDFSKIETKGFDSVDENFDFRRLIHDILDYIEPRRNTKQISLNTQIDNRLFDYYLSDPIKLQQIFVNLLDNAIKYTEKGSVSLEVKLLETFEDSQNLRILISDTGIGISPQNIEYIFEPFRQLEGSYTRKYSGIGLGLSIVKKLVESLGGQVTVESQLDQGTEFIIDLNLKKGYVQKDVSEKTGTDEKISGTGYRILIAEDEEINRKLLEHHLTNEKFSVHSVTNGYEVLEEMDKNPYDLIIMDIGMPMLNGIDAAKAIRRRTDKRYRNIPIIAWTAHAYDDDRKKCMNAGMNDFVVKPSEKQTLLDVIQKNILKRDS